MIDSSFTTAAEEVLGLVRDCDWDNMHMRTRHVVESDLHFSKPLPEPSERQIWEELMKTTHFTKVFLNLSDDYKEKLFNIASESGFLRGIQSFHNRLNEKVSAREQTEDANEMELIIPIEDEDNEIKDNGEVVQGKPRLRKEDG